MYKTHNLQVGDTVRLVNLNSHPFASHFLDEDETATIIKTEDFMGMQVAYAAQGDDKIGVAFADDDLDILVKLEGEN